MQDNSVKLNFTKAVIGLGDITIFSNGFKMNCGTRIYSDNIYRFPNQVSIFLANVFAIKQAVRTIETRNLTASNLIICVAVQAVITPLGFQLVKS